MARVRAGRAGGGLKLERQLLIEVVVVRGRKVRGQRLVGVKQVRQDVGVEGDLKLRVLLVSNDDFGSNETCFSVLLVMSTFFHFLDDATFDDDVKKIGNVQ